MAQNVTVAGASYSSVPSVTLPKTGGGTASFTDVTDTTATALDVAQGVYFYTAAGVKTVGTSTGGVIHVEESTAPSGGTIIDITGQESGGGATLIYSGTLGSQSITSTTATQITTIELGSSVWTYDKILYVTIWRTGRTSASGTVGFLGTEAFYLGSDIAYGITQDPSSQTSGNYLYPTGQVRYTNGYMLGTTQNVGYGIYPSKLTNTGTLTISGRYNSTYSGAISGTYDIAVYQMDWPVGNPWDYNGRS